MIPFVYAAASLVRTVLATAGVAVSVAFGCDLLSRLSGVPWLGTRLVRVIGAIGGALIVALGFWLSQHMFG